MRKLRAFTLLGLALASPAGAANWPDPRLDAAARQEARELKQLMEFALEGHRRKPPAYQGNC